MALILLSGVPGSGKTEFCRWLASERGYVYIETDAQWSTWGPLLCVQNMREATNARNQARALSPDVIIEWGFRVDLLDCVRRLRVVGFDTWWFDGDESAARQGYVMRRGKTPDVMNAYGIQVQAIQAARVKLERFYEGRIVRTVTAGPTYVPAEQIALEMFGDHQSAD